MQRTVVINVVGLTPSLIGEHTPHLQRFAAQGRVAHITSAAPAVTCSMQSTFLTGRPPSEHGIVANGWYFRDTNEIRFWAQSNTLVEAPKIWETLSATHPEFTCANFFWWYNMNSTADITVTPRPMYPADGRKLPDIYTKPMPLRESLQEALGPFPLFKFWGPATTIESTRWIAEAAIQVDAETPSTLTLIYLPHLDYNLQRLGPTDPRIAADLNEVDAVCGSLIDHFSAQDVDIVILSEYGIQPVSKPLHLNRILRQAGWLTTRDELGHELLDPGASDAFAVADHQIAHVYVKPECDIAAVKQLIESQPGVARVLDDAGKREAGMDHARSGELIALAEPDAWFTYYYWLDDARAPDFARTVDIHRKPGYDPVELFMALPEWKSKAQIMGRLLQKKLGLRTLMDVIPLAPERVKGSHGVAALSADDSALFITQRPELLLGDSLSATDVHDLIMRHVTDR